MTISRNLSFLAEGVSSTGVLGATYGGTGQSSITTGNILMAIRLKKNISGKGYNKFGKQLIGTGIPKTVTNYFIGIGAQPMILI